MSESIVRVGGSGYTVMMWQGKNLAYLQNITDTAPQAVKAPEPIQPIDEPFPLEVVTAQAVGAGQLALRFYELWNEPAWSMLPGLEGTTNLLDVLRRQLTLGAITCRKVIKNPTGAFRVLNYHNCVIYDIDQSESIEIGTMTIPRTIKLYYTHVSVV